MHHPTDRITHTTSFFTPVVEHWLEREIEYEDGGGEIMYIINIIKLIIIIIIIIIIRRR